MDVQTINVACEICSNTSGNRIHVTREMMFGLRHPFRYLECGNCGCLQLLDVPANMGDYYPPTYYSYQQHGRVMTYVRRKWAAGACDRKSLVGWFVTGLFGPNNAIRAVHRLQLPQDVKILELGSGSGRLLSDLQHFGYRNVTGADPYVPNDVVHPSGLTIYKKSLREMSGQFDLIMLHHAFEHMAAPRQTMKDLAKLLAPGGTLILRIPVASSYGWRHYGVNWVHLDPPRHLFLHTAKSMALLARDSGLEIKDVVHEADELSITGSENYAKDIAMNDPRYPLAKARQRLLGWRRRQQDILKAEEMNRREEGDQCCFYLKHAVAVGPSRTESKL